MTPRRLEEIPVRQVSVVPRQPRERALGPPWAAPLPPVWRARRVATKIGMRQPRQIAG